MPGADVLPHSVRVQREGEHRYKTAGGRLFAKESVQPIDCFVQFDAGAQLHLEAAKQHGTEEGGGHSFSGNVGENAEQFSGFQLHKVIEISADVASRFRKGMDIEILDFR